eukprot:scaffold13016_cov154-Amphora_coffeaeformis.AAC.5
MMRYELLRWPSSSAVFLAASTNEFACCVRTYYVSLTRLLTDATHSSGHPQPPISQVVVRRFGSCVTSTGTIKSTTHIRLVKLFS